MPSLQDALAELAQRTQENAAAREQQASTQAGAGGAGNIIGAILQMIQRNAAQEKVRQQEAQQQTFGQQLGAYMEQPEPFTDGAGPILPGTAPAPTAVTPDQQRIMMDLFKERGRGERLLGEERQKTFRLEESIRQQGLSPEMGEFLSRTAGLEGMPPPKTEMDAKAIVMMMSQKASAEKAQASLASKLAIAKMYINSRASLLQKARQMPPERVEDIINDNVVNALKVVFPDGPVPGKPGMAEYEAVRTQIDMDVRQNMRKAQAGPPPPSKQLAPTLSTGIVPSDDLGWLRKHKPAMSLPLGTMTKSKRYRVVMVGGQKDWQLQP